MPKTPPPVPTTEQLLIAGILNLPLAPAEVLGTFAGVVRQHAQVILTDWDGVGLVQALHPHCLGASRMQLYALTACGLRTLFPQLADQLTQATHWQLDPGGLVLSHVPALLRRQTAYRVAARIYAQAQADHPQARLRWRLFLDSHYHLTVDYDSPRRRGPTTRRITVPSDLALEVTVQDGEATTWEQAQVWLDDGLMALPRLQARLQVLVDASRHAPQTTPRTFVIVRDLARLGMWQLALDAVAEGGPLPPGALCLLPVPWPWPLSCGGQPAPARPWQEQWVPFGRARGLGSVRLPPLVPDRWRAQPVAQPFGAAAPATVPRRALPAWRRALLTDLTRTGTIAEARAVLAGRRTQQAKRATVVARACLEKDHSLALPLLAPIAATPLITRADLARLWGVTPRSLDLRLAPLQTAGLVEALTPRASPRLPLQGEGAALSGVRLTELGQRVLAALYPQPLAVYRRATREPRAHDSGVARFFT
ncbi:MAG: hypothetical protein H0X24_15705, partial [Ktedonobacterales bacterium]|nr:hypothetical protein [Ktedonobacterales bacterium]